MRKLRDHLLVTIFIIIATACMALAQGTMRKRMSFKIDAPFKLKMGGQVIPPGKYVLYQGLQNDPAAFHLHPDNLTNSPIATIHTVRVEYRSGEYPEEARVRFKDVGAGQVKAVTVDGQDMTIVLNIDKWSQDGIPVLRGWDIPGLDGWKIISVEVDEGWTSTGER